MSKITGKNLEKLGFKKETDKSDSANPYHYYVYEISDKCLLISNSNDERIDGGYDIEFYEIPDLKFRDLNHLKQLVELLKQVSNG